MSRRAAYLVRYVGLVTASYGAILSATSLIVVGLALVGAPTIFGRPRRGLVWSDDPELQARAAVNSWVRMDEPVAWLEERLDVIFGLAEPPDRVYVPFADDATAPCHRWVGGEMVRSWGCPHDADFEGMGLSGEWRHHDPGPGLRETYHHDEPRGWGTVKGLG